MKQANEIEKNLSIDTSNRRPLLGDDFPELDLQTTFGIKKFPTDFKNKWFVLFSHPLDFTPVCTRDLVSFQKNYEKFKELNCELISLSVDQAFFHMEWTEWIQDTLDVEIEFPMIADTGSISKALGLIQSGKGTNPVRATFVVDNNRKIRAIFYYPHVVGRSIAEIIEVIKGLQIVDKEKIVMSSNELLDNEVTAPLEQNITKIKDRFKLAEEGNFSCYDWWFCQKKL
jgi:peroxiredoxin 2/4